MSQNFEEIVLAKMASDIEKDVKSIGPNFLGTAIL